MVAAANLMKPLSRAERVEYGRLGEEMQRALEENDADRVAGLHARRLPYFARGAFLSPEKAKQFVDEYLAADAHRKLNLWVNRTVLAHYQRMSIWPGLDRVTASLLVLYGYQDFEPVTQAYRIRERVPQTSICFLNRCGHIPWLEQPEAFYRELEGFFGVR